MKKALSIILAAVILLSSMTFISIGESDTLSLTAASQYRFSDDGEYVVGIEGIPTADTVRAQFNEPANIKINTFSGGERTGKIASDDTVSLGEASKKLLVYGDVDRSASINARDVIEIMKYLCAYGNDICILASDVNVDNKTNAKDVILLIEYIVGYDIVLGDITYPAEEFKIDASFRIIMSNEADETEEEAASYLITALDSLYGHGLGVKWIVRDDKSAAKEIILGKCNRQFYEKDIAKLKSEGYLYDIINPSRIVIAGTDSEGTFEAVKRFLWDNLAYIDKYNTVNSAKIFDGTNYVDVKGSTTLVSGKSLFYDYPEEKATVTLNGVAIEDYTIVPRAETFESITDILVRSVRLLTGTSLRVDATYSGANAIYVGRMKNAGSSISTGLSYNIGNEDDSIYIDAFRYNVCRFAVRAFCEDHLLNDYSNRDIIIQGNERGAFNSNRLRMTASSSEQIANGVTYYQRSYVDPHFLKVETYAVVIENGKARLALGTPDGETVISGKLKTTSEEMKYMMNAGENVLCGINADFYDLGGTNHPKGLCVKDGTSIQNSNGRPWFAVLKNGSFEIGSGNLNDSHLAEITTGVGGSHIFLSNGYLGDLCVNGSNGYGADFGGIRHPRTAIGITENDDIVFLVVDGRMPSYSNGASITDLALLMMEYGVTDALNLDGGGSSTLAIVEEGSVIIKNTPCDVFERPIYDSIVVITD